MLQRPFANARVPRSAATTTKDEDVTDKTAPAFDVLMMNPLASCVETGLAASCKVHRYWEMADRASDLATVAPNIRAIVSGGDDHLPVDGALMGSLPALDIVANFGVGYNHVDAAWAGSNGIIVTHTPDVLNEEVADTAFGLMLGALRQLRRAENHLRAGKWPQGSFELTASLRGRTVGIFGLGRIGKVIAKRCEAFGLPVVYHGRHRQPDVTYPYFDSLVGLAAHCDVLVAIAPGGAGTAGAINAAVLDALGPDGVLVNVARGTVVDQDALIVALREKRILTAALDVFADEPQVPQALIDMEHVVLTPHVGSGTHPTRNAMGQLVVDNIRAWMDGKGPLTPVPETPWPATAK